jgi:two-component system, NtrC family, nitrogen regulation response regulator NtrX
MSKASAEAPRSEQPTVLVVDDDGDIRMALEMMLAYEGYEVWTARDGAEALARLTQEEAAGRRPAVILCDVKMPKLDGLQVLDAIAQRAQRPQMIMISGHGDIATAVDAVKRGATDFIEKPLEQNRVLVSINNALRERRLETENTGLRRQLSERWQLVGESEAMRALKEQVARVALSEASVLLTGENGTGKEVAARAIHLASHRAAGPFVTVNCAAIPAELIESELFGHEKGSFTGAHERRVGHFEAAHRGTLFLDEIGDMPLAAQAKVLRALETREIGRVGGTQPIAVDLRLLSATNADLAQALEAKTFRLDLFYRLNVVPLRIPSLRERREDLPLLCEHFLREIASRGGRAPQALDPEALELLKTQEFPGNVRQLRNVLEGASVFAQGPEITRADLQQILEQGGAQAGRASGPGAAAADPFQAPTFEQFKDQSEALFFQRKLSENHGNVKRTAELLAMQRSHLYKKLDRYGLR